MFPQQVLFIFIQLGVKWRQLCVLWWKCGICNTAFIVSVCILYFTWVQLDTSLLFCSEMALLCLCVVTRWNRWPSKAPLCYALLFILHIPFAPWGGYLKTLSILDDWLTVHRSITLVDLQLDAQNSYLFTYNTFIKILYMFRALPCLSTGDLCHNCIYAASGIVTLCRWLSCAPV